MAIDYGEVFQVMGSVLPKHAGTVKKLIESKSMLQDLDWDHLKKQYEDASAKAASGPMSTVDKGAILMQIVALNPKSTDTLIDLLVKWGVDPDLITLLREFKAASIEANKD